MKLFPFFAVKKTTPIWNTMFKQSILPLFALGYLSCSSAPQIKKTSLKASLNLRCEQGDVQSCVDVAKTILSDKKGDSVKATALLEASCQKGHLEGCFIFAQMLERGIGREQNFDEAKMHYRFACKNGITQACNNLAILLKVTGEDLTLVNALQEHGCEEGDAIACFNLGFKAEHQSPKNWELARENYDKSCQAGFAEGCSYLGILYRYGNGVEVDLKRGAELYRKSCLGGYMIGCNSMGYLYQIGSGVEKNDTLSTQYYSQACEGGLTRACTNLGTLAESSDKKGKSAYDFYVHACKSGDGKGCSRLGVLYLGGTHGAKKDEKKALESFILSCENNYGPGCCNVGVVEEDGIGKKPDYKKAKTFYERACKLDEYKGCHNLGVMYAEGVGEKADMGVAADQFMTACENGFTASCSYLGKKWSKTPGKENLGKMLLQKACKAGDPSVCVLKSVKK